MLKKKLKAIKRHKAHIKSRNMRKNNNLHCYGLNYGYMNNAEVNAENLEYSGLPGDDDRLWEPLD